MGTIVGVLQILAKNDSSNGTLKALACGLLFATTLMALPACAADVAAADASSTESMAAPHLSVVTEALPEDFSAKSLKVGLTVIEIEHLDALDSDIVYIRLTENQAPDAVFRVLNAAFPAAQFERLEDGGSDFDLVDF